MELFFGGSSGHLLADRRYGLALELTEGGDYAASIDLLHQAIELAPHWPPLHFHLGEAHRLRGDMAKAIAAFKHYLALDGDDTMGATIKLSLLGEINAPASMPEGYVRSLFHQYAPKFEKCLVENLSYHIPEIIAGLVKNIRPAGFYHLLDLGCGTGLSALQFKGRAKRMTGVDLAPGMIEEAKRKGIFDDLHICNIETFLDETGAVYDLILSTDVFVYIGALETLFQKIAHVMGSEGLFAFSVQSMEDSDGDWKLGADHRYAQSKAYVERCATMAGFEVIASENTNIRLEAGEFIKGMVFICLKK